MHNTDLPVLNSVCWYVEKDFFLVVDNNNFDVTRATELNILFINFKT